MAAKRGEVFNLQVLSRLQFLELLLVDVGEEKMVWIRLVIQRQI